MKLKNIFSRVRFALSISYVVGTFLFNYDVLKEDLLQFLNNNHINFQDFKNQKKKKNSNSLSFNYGFMGIFRFSTFWIIIKRYFNFYLERWLYNGNYYFILIGFLCFIF